MIHTGSSYALGLLENLMHWNRARLPPEMRYVVAVVPEGVGRSVVDPQALPGWDRPDYAVSRRFADLRYDEGVAPVLVVPSVLSPFEPNVLINQAHPGARRIEVSGEQPAVVDLRLIG